MTDTDNKPPPLARGGSFCSPPGAVGRSKAGTSLVCRLDRTGHRNRWQLPVPEVDAVKPLPTAPVPLARPVPLVDGEQELPLPMATPTPGPDAEPAAEPDLLQKLLELSPHPGRNPAQHVPPIRWTYTTGAVDPDCAHLVPDLDAANAAIRAYTGDKNNSNDSTHLMTPNVNAALRGSLPMTPGRAATIATLDGLFPLSRIPEPITVYRGYLDGRHILPPGWRDTDLTGLTWSDPGFTSTSGDLNYTQDYVSSDDTDCGFAVRINLPADSPALTIWDDDNGDGWSDDEGEVLLPRGLTFRVIEDRGSGHEYGIRWLDVEVTQP